MQPLLTIVTGAVGFATTVWIVYRLLRSTFPTAAPNPLGVGLIAVAIWLLVFRLFAVALFLFVLGAVLLVPRSAPTPRSAPPRQKSRVRSAHLEMTLDHDSGHIDGRILSGSREGQALSDLSLPELLQVFSQIRADDQSVQLLETYLDRAHPDWRERADQRADPGAAPPPQSGEMSREDAYRVLGLEPGATEDEIRAAYRRLIKRLHPDSGGSAALTAQITAARDRLLDDA